MVTCVQEASRSDPNMTKDFVGSAVSGDRRSPWQATFPIGTSTKFCTQRNCGGLSIRTRHQRRARKLE
jgi:hypothetical protein